MWNLIIRERVPSSQQLTLRVFQLVECRSWRVEMWVTECKCNYCMYVLDSEDGVYCMHSVSKDRRSAINFANRKSANLRLLFYIYRCHLSGGINQRGLMLECTRHATSVQRCWIITINLPVVYMARDVMNLMRENPFRGPWEGVGPETALALLVAISGPKKVCNFLAHSAAGIDSSSQLSSLCLSMQLVYGTHFQASIIHGTNHVYHPSPPGKLAGRMAGSRSGPVLYSIWLLCVCQLDTFCIMFTTANFCHVVPVNWLHRFS